MNSKPSKRQPRLFDRVAAILEEARAAVVRTVNTRMVVAYWLIGREIVQGADRLPQIRHEPRGELAANNACRVTALIADTCEKSHTWCGELAPSTITGFASQLSWSHYRLLMRVENQHVRAFEDLLRLLRKDWDMVVREQQSVYGVASANP